MLIYMSCIRDNLGKVGFGRLFCVGYRQYIRVIKSAVHVAKHVGVITVRVRVLL